MLPFASLFPLQAANNFTSSFRSTGYIPQPCHPSPSILSSDSHVSRLAYREAGQPRCDANKAADGTRGSLGRKIPFCFCFLKIFLSLFFLLHGGETLVFSEKINVVPPYTQPQTHTFVMSFFLVSTNEVHFISTFHYMTLSTSDVLSCNAAISLLLSPSPVPSRVPDPHPTFNLVNI